MKYAFLFGSVIFSALAQLLMKWGIAGSGHPMTSSRFWLSSTLQTLGDWRVLAGLAAYGVAAVFWLAALARFPLSYAYPFVSLGFVLTMLASAAFLGESLSAGRIIGTLVIATGAIIIGRS